MAVNITIPSPGESISEVTLGPWRKPSGSWVKKDEPLVEIESDKVTLEIVAPESGVLNVTAQAGAEMKVGAVVGTIDPAAKPTLDGSSGSAGAGDAGSTATATAASDTSGGQGAGSRVTPVARKVAADMGVNLARVQGTGPSGRITKSDVLAATGPATVPATLPATARASTGGSASTMPMKASPTVIAIAGGVSRGVRREKMTKLRQRIAQRLVEAQHTAAMLTTFNEADMTEVMRLRGLYKESFEKSHGVGLGFMSFFVKAAVSALQKFPRVNAYVMGDEIEYHDFNDVSVAVGTDKGLVVPVLRNAELLTFAQIELGIKDLAVRAREGKLTIEEMTGGTFTISNGGVYGSLNSTPILNPPQSAILGLHAIKNRPVEDPRNAGQIVLRPMMNLAVSYDHRIIDGSEAVSFLVHIKQAIESPERLLLGV